MNVIAILLIIAPTLGERQLNLEDIEKDNLQLETKSKDESASYVATVEYSQPYAVTPNVHDSANQQKTVYTATQANVEYNTYETQTESYKDGIKYSDNDLTYQKENQDQGSKDEYFEDSSKFQVQQTKPYQQEIIVGNHLQSEQQKSAKIKYGKNNKDSVYVTIPAEQLYTYYPHLGTSQINAKTRAQYLSYGETSQHIPVSAHTPSFSQKVPYQIQPHYLSYLSAKQHHPYTEAIFPTKVPNSHYMLHKLRPQVSQSYPQYVQQVIYVKPGMVYTQGTPIYNDLYARTPTYTQDNSLYNQAQRSHQDYVSSAIAEQLAKHILEDPQINSIASQHKKLPASSAISFVAPQYQVQKFRSSITQMVPVSVGNEVVFSKHYAALSHEPKSLLDTYIPSYVIAAHDSERYKEKPIKLEGGFLPSNINFIHEYKKRTT